MNIPVVIGDAFQQTRDAMQTKTGVRCWLFLTRATRNFVQ